MDQARLALDYLDVVIWPLLVAAVVWLLVTKFRAEFAALIGRIKSLSSPLGTVQMTEQQTAEPEGIPAVVAFLSNILARKEEEIVQHKLVTTNVAVELERYRLGYFFERTYRVIYGTQINLLRYLSYTGGASADELSHFNEEHLRLMRAAWPAYNYAPASYLGFLQSSSLITVQDGKYSITELGRSFLQWMAAEVLYPAKAF